MMDYPTEEEEYELMYGDELDMLDDDDFNPSARQTTSVAKINTPVINKLPARRNLDFDVGLSQSSAIPSTPNLSQISTVSHNVFVHNKPKTRAVSTPFSTAGPSTAPDFDEEPAPIRKRRLEDLFGDIDDIRDYDYEDEHLAKKSKKDEDPDLVLIDKILEARRLYKEKLNPLSSNSNKRLLTSRPEWLQNMSYSIPKWPFVTVTRSDGQTIYVRSHSTQFESERIAELKFSNYNSEGGFGLLGSVKTNVWRQAKEYLNKKETANNDIQVVSEIRINNDSGNLWVDLYRPRKYIELLSDEGTNRALLHWLKMWDQIVFNREPKKIKVKNTNEVSNFNKKTGKFDNTKWKTKKKNQGPVLNTERDELGRPMQKIALLCGPPGLGKTTLAHTIARHAGYNVMELNASDDRSPEAFKTALENGTQMKAVFSNENRPNCIILDEIDGAPVASIDFLIKFASGTVPIKGKKGKTAKTHTLRRPIICICNDVYVPALRALRQIAFVVTFPPTENARLAERLSEISSKQKLRTDLGALLALADKTHCDVRACLSVLQFFSGQNKPLRIRDVYKNNIGQKDMQKGLFGVWKDIFQVQRPKRSLVGINNKVVDLTNENDQETAIMGMTDMSLGSRMRHVLETVQSSGDYERLTQGVYENYLHMRMPDPDMRGVCDALKWFCFSDIVNRTVHQHQNYSVYPYLQYGFVAWHFNFASLAWQKLTFPSKGFEASQKQATILGIVEALRRGAGIGGRTMGSPRSLVVDSLPLIRRILNPVLRSVSLQLLSPRERADLRHAVNIMVDLGLGYSQGRSVDGTYTYQMEPDLEQIGVFQDIQPLTTLSYWIKQLIAREVEVERMRRSAPKAELQTNSAKPGASTAKQSTKENSIPNHLQRLQPKRVKPKEVVTKDFFGRLVTKPQTVSSKIYGGGDAIVKSPIWYHFKEGCNNAVRKNVKMFDLV